MSSKQLPFDAPIPTTETPATAQKSAKGKIVGHPELIAMDGIYRVIMGLPEVSRGRVVAWLVENFKQAATESAK